MNDLEDLAELVKDKFGLKYEPESIKYLEGFIERSKVELPREKWSGLINSLGAFLGQCIIENYGGAWDKDDKGNVLIRFDDKNAAYPFNKVSKQFENGLEDSIHSFFTSIPVIFKIEMKPNEKKWWQF